MRAPEEVFDVMYRRDAFSQWLGITLIEIKEKYCQIKMTVREEMTNGFQIAHGGIAYSLADSCLAFAANTEGIQAITIESAIHHLKAIQAGDELIATASNIHSSTRLSHYEIKILNQRGTLVAWMKGIVYKKLEN
jgi:acyl-CoA thioesterase